ncbi:unnamed protein product [Oikopleura dioica]|uniref:EF-hand domain-containing protein n=1 Tax=Oikopleura dioica TaxID=34765 RepID=E4YS21_OIKDI|nr:unnamed protein product [Oikopleura dioica]
MGCFLAKLTDETIEMLEKTTPFSRSEIIDWHECFYTDSPGGAMSQFEFTKMYCQFFPKGDPTDFSQFLFKSFDENGDGSIEFGEFLNAISMTSRGSIEQKLEWAFKLYDIDGDGAITKDEMLQIVRAMFSMFGEEAIKNLEENTPEKRVEKIFALVDTDGNGDLSKEEFIQAAKLDSAIVNALSLYDGLI